MTLNSLLAACTSAFALGLCAATPTGLIVNDAYVGAATSGVGWNYSDGWIHLTKPDWTYVISGSNTTHNLGIKVEADNCSVKIYGLNLHVDPDRERGAIVLMGNIACKLTFWGENSLRSGSGYAGIEVQSEAALTICNGVGEDSSLTVQGGKYGAGIGGAKNTRHPGSITIDCDARGTISAYGNFGAGIGGGMKYNSGETFSYKGLVYKQDVYRGGDCNNPIVINGGHVYAYGSMGSAGIGGGGGSALSADSNDYFAKLGGNCLDIRINGGSVEAWGSDGLSIGTRFVGFSPGIGCGTGAKTAKGIQITGGTVHAKSTILEYSIGSCDGLTETGPVVISGGSVLASGSQVAKMPVNQFGETVYAVTAMYLPKNQKITLGSVYRTRGTGDLSVVDYGEKDLMTDDYGRLHLHFPFGTYLFEVRGRTYTATVGASNVVTSVKMAKASMSDSSRILTFYYDDQPIVGTIDQDWFAIGDAELMRPDQKPPWNSFCGTVEKVVFNDSFKAYAPKHFGGWFSDFGSLSKVVGIENLKTYGATSMAGMFRSCSLLKSLDLSGFVTTQVTDMSEMFSGCNHLTTIFASDDFTTAKVTSSANMFTGCTALVGGNKTVYSPSRTGKTYALVDGKDGRLGYFTDKKAPYVIVFGKNGGSEGESRVDVSCGQVMPTITPPTKSGYTFAGYWTTIGADGVKYYNMDGTSARNWDKTSGATLWAKWIVAEYVVTFGKNGGQNGDDYVTVVYGETPHDVHVPAKTGSIFGGYWTTCAEGKGVQYFSAVGKGLFPYDRKADTTLWALWRNVITFGKNGGTGGDDKVTVVYGQVPHKITPPTRKGYIFDGYWTTVNAGGVQYYTADGQGAKMWTGEKNATHWAKWVAGTGYKVSFGLNGGTGGAYVYAAKDVAMPKITPPTRAGYSFDGYWNTTAAGGARYYNADGTSARSYDKSAATVLYAKWVKNGSCVKTIPASRTPVLQVGVDLSNEVLIGLLADGTGSYTLLADSDGATGFVSVELFDGGTFVAEVEIEVADGGIVLVTEDGETIPLGP